MKKIFIIIIALGLLSGCEEEQDYDFGPKPEGGDFTVIVDTVNTLQVKFVPVNVDTTQVGLAWDFGLFANGRGDRSIEYSPEIVYPDEGAYTVTMTTYNDGGVTSTTKEVTLELPPGPNIPPDIKVLAGINPLGKAWIVDRFTDGHSSAGREANEGDITSFWSRPAGNMKCLGMYNDVYIFKAVEGQFENNEFVLSTGGDVYTRAGLDSDFEVSMTPDEAGCFEVEEGEEPPVLSGSDRLALYEAPDDLTYNITTRASDGTKILTLSPGGYLGMWVKPQEYELLTFNENEIVARFIQEGGTVAWGVRLVPLPDEYYNLTGGTLEGKTWVIDKDTDGHSAAGRVESGTETDFWSRAAGSMECLGLYNDEYTFKLDGLEFVLETGGDVYTRNTYIDQYEGAVASSDVCPAGTVSGNDYKADFVSPGDLHWTMTTREEDGATVIRFSEKAYLGMDVDAPEYEILVINPNELYVRFVQSTGVVAWYKRLVPKEEG